jgi:hypothetical protein
MEKASDGSFLNQIALHMSSPFCFREAPPEPVSHSPATSPIKSIFRVDHNTRGHWHNTENGQRENSDLVRAA